MHIVLLKLDRDRKRQPYDGMFEKPSNTFSLKTPALILPYQEEKGALAGTKKLSCLGDTAAKKAAKSALKRENRACDLCDFVATFPKGLRKHKER